MNNNNSLGKSLIKSKRQVIRQRRNLKEGVPVPEWDSLVEEGKKTKITGQSVTDESSLDEFLVRAELAGTLFAAERMQAKIVSSETNEFVGAMSPAEIEKSRKLQSSNQGRLKLPRRPAWSPATTPKELDRQEAECFLEWRKNLAGLHEVEGLVLTPFERNLELWRQLWRVLERSHVVVQIVDARNPLLFRSEDLERYTKEIDSRKLNVLLLNKADLLTEEQRRVWAEYFKTKGVRAVLWSAAEKEHPASVTPESYSSTDEDDSLGWEDSDAEEAVNHVRNSEEPAEKSRILSSEELLEMMHSLASKVEDAEAEVVFGMVGYPNVGKSSTINRLTGQKKVSVSVTPGKTRHFQTLSLDEGLVLCDCPGLVMPSFALSREEMVVNGILSVNQLRGSPAPPIGLLCSKFPRTVWESRYGIVLPGPSEEEKETRPTSHELLTSVAFARGFMSAKGIPDGSRAARLILNDVVTGKIVWAAAPPGMNQEDFDDFQLYFKDPKSVAGASAQLRQLEKRNLVDSKRETADMDRQFFQNRQSQIVPHKKGIQIARNEEKGAKKHFNRHKKGKLRRLFRDLDA